MASASGAKRTNDSACPSSVKRSNNKPSREVFNSKDSFSGLFGLSDEQSDSISDLLKRPLDASSEKELSDFLSGLSNEQSASFRDFLGKCQDTGECPVSDSLSRSFMELVLRSASFVSLDSSLIKPLSEDNPASASAAAAPAPSSTITSSKATREHMAQCPHCQEHLYPTRKLLYNCENYLKKNPKWRWHIYEHKCSKNPSGSGQFSDLRMCTPEVHKAFEGLAPSAGLVEWKQVTKKIYIKNKNFVSKEKTPKCPRRISSGKTRKVWMATIRNKKWTRCDYHQCDALYKFYNGIRGYRVRSRCPKYQADRAMEEACAALE